MKLYRVQITYAVLQSGTQNDFTVVRQAKDAGTAAAIATSLFNSLSNYVDEDGFSYFRIINVLVGQYNPNAGT